MTQQGFFAAQRHHKRLSLVFYRLFAFVVFLHALGLFLLCLVLGAVLTGDILLSYWLFCVFLLFVYLVLGVFVGRYRLVQGGSAIAKRMGAVRLFIDKNADYQEAQFFDTFIRAGSIQDFPSSYARAYEFAEQIGLAAGVAVPALYVLPNQTNINACVAGFDDADMVMILTQGAVDNLNNEALYALIAHQYSAILHGDAHLNLKVGMMSTGLSWLYECADWLENAIFGQFDASYHTKLGTQSEPFSKSDWVRHWQSDSKMYGQQRNDDALAALVFPVLFLLFFVFVLRIMGLLGAVSRDWIVSRFNRERSFLADATSVQLTRSDGIEDLIDYTKVHSSFLTGSVANHLGYFFFAPIGEQAEFFDTHPSPDERLTNLWAKSYFAFGRTMAQSINKTALQQSHHAALNYAPVLALAQEVFIETVQYVNAPQDTIVDGRLVANEAWLDWSSTHEESVPSQPCVVSTHAFKDHALPSLIDLQTLKDVSLPWVISKHLRAPLSTLLVIEGLLLMRFEKLSLEKVTLGQIYGEPSFDVYLHDIGEELLRAMAGMDRRCDGALLLLAIKKFRFHLNNHAIALSDKQCQLLRRYHDSLLGLKAGKAFALPESQKELLAACERFLCALVLANVWQILSKKHSTTDTVMSAHEGFGILLAFLVSVQDNSLLTKQTQSLLVHLDRLCRLSCIDTLDFDAICVAHSFGVLDWVQLLLGLSALDNKKRAIETLASACYHDGVLVQKEYDMLELLGELMYD